MVLGALNVIEDEGSFAFDRAERRLFDVRWRGRDGSTGADEGRSGADIDGDGEVGRAGRGFMEDGKEVGVCGVRGAEPVVDVVADSLILIEGGCGPLAVFVVVERLELANASGVGLVLALSLSLSLSFSSSSSSSSSLLLIASNLASM